MNRSKLTWGLFFILLYGCNGIVVKNTERRTMDSSLSSKIDTFRIKPKKTFDINTIVKSSEDTLYIVSCSEYVYSPFGVIKEKRELKESSLKNFNLVSRKEKMINGTYEFQRLNLDSNKLVLFFDDDREASRESYILKGEIKNGKVRFDNNIRIGMDAESFYGIFFLNSSNELENKFHVFILETCASGTKHIYRFDKNKLQSVKFETPASMWKIEY